MTPKQIAAKLEGVPPGALLLIKNTDDQFHLNMFKDLNHITGHLGCDWGVTEGANYTTLASHSHCSRIKSIQVLRR